VFRGSGLTLQNNDLSSTELINLLFEERDPKQYRKTFAGSISGPAGAGKSFFMRHLYLELTRSERSRIPVFLEARDLNDSPPLDFPRVIMKAFKASGCDISVERAKEGLLAGLFCILFDGFDEIRISLEQHYAKELDRAAEAYAECPLIVSGRPSELLQSSSHFENCNLLPLEQEDAVALVQKLDFDETTKNKFQKLIVDELWNTHEEFLEVPLLCVVMLLTYSDAGRISRRQHEFYEDAYNALWCKHDARKQAGFEREKYTKLDKQQFEKLASAFCASSYISEHFSMRDRDLLEHLANARRLTGISAEDKPFIKDMSVSTSLLVLDGSRYRFSHRSFQEYLCANYVLTLGDENILDVIDTVSYRYETDSVLGFIKSIDIQRFETAWVLPKLEALQSKLEKAKSDFKAYRALLRDDDTLFLMKLRSSYNLHPDNGQIMAAVDSAVHMGRKAVEALSMLGGGQAKVFSKDIRNILSLHADLKRKYDKRDSVLKSLFLDRGRNNYSEL